MSSARAHSARSVAGPARLLRAWRQLTREQRLAAVAAFCLFLTLFLPWYQREFFVVIAKKPLHASDSLTGWAAFSWVEAAVLLVACGVLVLLFERAEGRAFHLPGGDGSVITAAGAWTCLLVIWRIFDKQGATAGSQSVTTSGIEWGIFVALAVAGLLTYAGTRMRASHQPEPPLPTEGGAVFDGRWHRPDDEHGGPARRPAAGADASARRARRAAARAGSVPEPVAAQDPSPRAESLAEPPRERAGGRSSWRPADKPEWSEPQRPLGWLTTPPGPGVPPAAETSETAPQPPAPPPLPAEDLTIPLDSDEA